MDEVTYVMVSLREAGLNPASNPEKFLQEMESQLDGLHSRSSILKNFLQEFERDVKVKFEITYSRGFRAIIMPDFKDRICGANLAPFIERSDGQEKFQKLFLEFLKKDYPEFINDMPQGVLFLIMNIAEDEILYEGKIESFVTKFFPLLEPDFKGVNNVPVYN